MLASNIGFVTLQLEQIISVVTRLTRTVLGTHMTSHTTIAPTSLNSPVLLMEFCHERLQPYSFQFLVSLFRLRVTSEVYTALLRQFPT
jgi:hypothetical protein